MRKDECGAGRHGRPRRHSGGACAQCLFLKRSAASLAARALIEMLISSQPRRWSCDAAFTCWKKQSAFPKPSQPQSCLRKITSTCYSLQHNNDGQSISQLNISRGTLIFFQTDKSKLAKTINWKYQWMITSLPYPNNALFALYCL